MPNFFPKRPFFGSTDWGAQQFLGLLDQEEREKAERRRLQETGWRPDNPSAPPATEADPRFGDGRDALIDLVQADLDHRQALQDEARRRVTTQLAQAQPDASFIPPRKPERPGAAQARPTVFPIPPQKPASVPQATIPPWRQDPRANRIIEDILRVEGGKSSRSRQADAGGRTNFGITTQGIKEWKRLAKLKGFANPNEIPDDPFQLTRDQAFQVFKQAYYDKFGLENVEDERLAHQLADIFVNTSPRGATHITNNALNEVMQNHDLIGEGHLPLAPGALRTPPHYPRKDWYPDPTRFGASTIGRLNMLVRDGFGPELRNALVGHRLGYAQTDPNYAAKNPGWNDRFARFMDWQHTPRGERHE